MAMAGPNRGRGRGGMGARPGIRPDFGPGGLRMGHPCGGNQGVTEVQFAVPANKWGLVISKSGETVRNINQQSGAHVEIARGASPNPHEKIFIIRGNPQQTQHAKLLIMECVGGMVSHFPFLYLNYMKFFKHCIDNFFFFSHQDKVGLLEDTIWVEDPKVNIRDLHNINNSSK